MQEVEVFKFHKNGLIPPIKKIMPYNEFLKLKSEEYFYRAYQIGFNTTIL